MELAALWLAAGLLLLLSAGPAAALATMYVLGLCAAATWCLLAALKRERLARWAGRAMLGQALLLAWASRFPAPSPPDLPIPRSDFPSPAARVWQEIQLPAEWNEVPGEPWIYVGLAGVEPEQFLECRPVLEIERRRLGVELDPWAPQRWVRGRLPREHLGRQVRIAFGFERPQAGLTVFLAPYLRGSTLRVPSAWTADGSPPPRGPALPLRTPGILGRLAGQSPVAASLWRHAIEARLLASDSATTPNSPARILAGCY